MPSALRIFKTLEINVLGAICAGVALHCNGLQALHCNAPCNDGACKRVSKATGKAHAKTRRSSKVLKLGSSKVLKFGCRLHRTTLLVLNRQDAKSAKGICNITAKYAKIAKEVLKFGSSRVLKFWLGLVPSQPARCPGASWRYSYRKVGRAVPVCRYAA